MPLDRQAIERRDFPISRRGYDPAAVDAHLRGVAAELEELQRARAAGADESLAATASSHVQGIVHAAETAATEIERQAAEAARNVRDEAARDAQRTRDDAVDKARNHVAAVAQLTATMLERIGSMDAETRGLIDSLRAGGESLARDLAAVETNMGELYDAASGRTRVDADAAAGQRAAQPEQSPPAPPPEAPPPITADAPVAAAESAKAGPAPMPPAAAGSATPTDAPGAAAPAQPAADADLDGARLIALNMALNGESRADTERYLAENFTLSDRGKLVDEVYAAIEA